MNVSSSSLGSGASFIILRNCIASSRLASLLGIGAPKYSIVVLRNCLLRLPPRASFCTFCSATSCRLPATTCIFLEATLSSPFVLVGWAVLEVCKPGLAASLFCCATCRKSASQSYFDGSFRVRPAHCLSVPLLARVRLCSRRTPSLQAQGEQRHGAAVSAILLEGICCLHC